MKGNMIRRNNLQWVSPINGIRHEMKRGEKECEYPNLHLSTSSMKARRYQHQRIRSFPGKFFHHHRIKYSKIPTTSIRLDQRTIHERDPKNDSRELMNEEGSPKNDNYVVRVYKKHICIYTSTTHLL